MEDEDSVIHLRNLSIHRANNEEEALNLVRLEAICQHCLCAHLQAVSRGYSGLASFTTVCLLCSSFWVTQTGPSVRRR